MPLDKMKILLTLLTFGYCIATSFNCSIPESVEDRRFDKSKWTISQFNVEWLFTEPYKDCPGSGCEWNSTVEEYDHMKSIAQVLLDSLDYVQGVLIWIHFGTFVSHDGLETMRCVVAIFVVN